MATGPADSNGNTTTVQTDSQTTVINASDRALERFARSFETSARRWELVVYPALFAFVVLAGYGFFLIFSLTQDMRTLARNMDPQMSDNMASMAASIATLSGHVANMTDRINEMSIHVESMAMDTMEMSGTMVALDKNIAAMSVQVENLEPMTQNMAAMNRSMQVMTANTGVMTRDLGGMSSNVARPLNFMNSFFPW
jgi:hypothetical protein